MDHNLRGRLERRSCSPPRRRPRSETHTPIPDALSALASPAASRLSNPTPTTIEMNTSDAMDIDPGAQEIPGRMPVSSHVYANHAQVPQPLQSHVASHSRSPNVGATSDDDDDRDLPGLLASSDSEASDTDAHNVETMMTNGDSEAELSHDLAQMPSLERVHNSAFSAPPQNASEITPVEPMPSPGRHTHTTAIRTGTRRARVENDDELDGPTPSSSSSSFNPSSTQNRPDLPSGPGPNGLGQSEIYQSRPIRPLPRNGPPLLRTLPTAGVLFGAPGAVGSGPAALDAGSVFRQMLTRLFRPHQQANQDTARDTVPQPPITQQSQQPPSSDGTQNTTATTVAPSPDAPSNASANSSPRQEHGQPGPSTRPASQGVVPGIDISIHVITDANEDMFNFQFPLVGNNTPQNIRGEGQATNATGTGVSTDAAAGTATGTGVGSGTSPAGGIGASAFNPFDFLRFFFSENGLAGLSSYASMQREDPERARRLAAALEPVPEGLVKRMEQVGGAPGVHEYNVGREGEEAQCSVCWDSLLNAENDGFVNSMSTGDSDSNAEQSVQPEPSADDPPELPLPSSSTESAIPNPEQIPDEISLPKVVALPCAHVFHSACLLPWFSRPGRQTCPVCRFNIDPDNLTYKPQNFVRRPMPAGNGDEPAGTAAQPNLTQTSTPASGNAPENTNTQFSHVEDEQIPTGAQETASQSQPSAHQARNEAIRDLPPFMGFGHGTPPRDLDDAFSMNIDFVLAQPMPEPVQEGFHPGLNAQSQGARQGQTNGPAETNVGAGLAPPSGPDQPPETTGVHGAQQQTNDGRPHPMDARTFIQELFARGMGFGGGGLAASPGGILWVAGVPMFGRPGGPEGPMQEQRQRPMQDQRQGPESVPPLRAQMRLPERREWTLPPPPGLTLRQRVERCEREAGLRCDDISCGPGPTDDDPIPHGKLGCLHLISIIRDLKPGSDNDSKALKEAVCPHRFHPSCLVDAGRVAGWGNDAKNSGSDVEMSCPRCRSFGHVERSDWDEGVRNADALL